MSGQPLTTDEVEQIENLIAVRPPHITCKTLWNRFTKSIWDLFYLATTFADKLFNFNVGYFYYVLFLCICFPQFFQELFPLFRFWQMEWLLEEIQVKFQAIYCVRV